MEKRVQMTIVARPLSCFNVGQNRMNELSVVISVPKPPGFPDFARRSGWCFDRPLK